MTQSWQAFSNKPLIGLQLQNLPIQLFTPSPTKPSLHTHLYDPAVFAQLAFWWQVYVSGDAHSFMSEQKEREIIIVLNTYKGAANPILLGECKWNFAEWFLQHIITFSKHFWRRNEGEGVPLLLNFSLLFLQICPIFG